MTTPSTTGTPAPNPRTYTHWVTRDSDPESGIPAGSVKVWLARPTRCEDRRGASWASDHLEEYYGEWTLAECYYFVKTWPDDDRQCIRVEGDSTWQPGDALEQKAGA